VVAILLGVGILQALDRRVPTTIPNSRLILDLPPNWSAVDAGQVFDDAWAAEQRQKYPQEAPMIDGLVAGAKSGGLSWFARINTNGDQTSDGWVLIAVHERSKYAANLREEATRSVIFQTVSLRAGPDAIDVSLPTGPAARLDWSYDLRSADGTSEIGTVRSYWLVDGTNTIVVQLTYYGDHPELVTSLDAVAATFHWAPGSGQPLSSAAERWQSGRLRRS
jgi:hypothetical protein